uniref:Uncharacterized protein n=1 Tax=Arundo donax TaxID=35708 RepID=A0A0A8Z8K6_ARUDO
MKTKKVYVTCPLLKISSRDKAD